MLIAFIALGQSLKLFLVLPYWVLVSWLPRYWVRFFLEFVLVLASVYGWSVRLFRWSRFSSQWRTSVSSRCWPPTPSSTSQIQTRVSCQLCNTEASAGYSLPNPLRKMSTSSSLLLHLSAFINTILLLDNTHPPVICCFSRSLNKKTLFSCSSKDSRTSESSL